MSEAANTTETKIKRERQFGRVYNHETGEVTITAAFDKDFKKTISLSAFPENVLRGFALQAVADYFVNEANDVLKDTKETPEESERRKAAIEVFDEVEGDLKESKIDFRTGTGIGGARSAIGALGQALFELGKKFVMLPDGTKLEFSDLHGARGAVKTLYMATEPVGEKKITGRMIFNAIQADETVAAKLAELRKSKKAKVDTTSFLG